MSDRLGSEMTAARICDQLGRKAIAKRVSRGVTAVSNAAVEGCFPSSWYLAIKTMCDEAGVDCPVSAFKFVNDGRPETKGDAA